jgi:predicted nucleic acid-binding protein
MIVLDTTVLVYATGAESVFRQPCRDLLAAIEDGRLSATTTPGVIQEFVHVRARRRGREDAAALASDFARALAPLLTVTRDRLERGIELFARAERLGAFDAVLAATALDAGAAALVSADRAFSAIPGVTHVVPDAAGVALLTARGERAER